MSLKINRLESTLVKEISYILANEVKDKSINFVTVTATKINNDFSLAKIYITVLEESKKEETILALNKAKGFIRTKLHERIDIRQVPELIFVYDDSIAYGNKIENIIDKLNKK